MISAPLPVRELSAEAMLDLWMLHSTCEPLRTDAAVTRSYAVDFRTLMAGRMRAWYIATLLNAPPEVLPLTDIASSLSVVRTPSGAGVAELPAGVLRVVSVEAADWAMPALVTSDPSSPLARSQASPYSCGRSVRPVVVVSGSVMRVFSPPEQGLSSVLAVMLPPEGTYRITDAMIPLIPKFENCYDSL